VALPLRRPGHPGVLARRAGLGRGPLPDIAGVGVGGVRDGRGRDPARHDDQGRGKLRRYAWSVRARFGITRLLNVDLLPRTKRINKVCLYRPAAGDPGAYPGLAPALTRPIRWDLIADNYDQVIRHATAIREGTASTEAVLSRFTRSATHPAYQAMLEIGRAQRTIFVLYLLDHDLQREIEEGLNVVEAWNGTNVVICYGRGGEISTNWHEEVEMTALCLRILQATLVYVNTLMLQDVLAEEERSALLGPADRRGLTPLLWQHVRPYGEVRLDMGSRLRIGEPGRPARRLLVGREPRDRVL
jgi:Tn3 transposase DDE domain